MIKLSLEDKQQLIYLLQSLPEMANEASRRQILELAGLRNLLPLLDLSGPPLIATSQIVGYLENYGKLSYDREALGAFLCFVKNFLGIEHAQYLENIIAKYSMLSVDKANSIDYWHNSENIETIAEKIIGENTLRPVAFLTQGVLSSKSVCLVRVNADATYWSGTGFMVSKNILATCNHVIPIQDLLKNTVFRFNYEESFEGRAQQVTDYQAKPNGLFFTSEELDFTIIELDDDASNKWGYLTFSKTIPHKSERVNIIQHPEGQPKQISFQNNFIEYADETIIQYLTSTLPGSSGAPVFSDSWEVVAIHRAGGSLREPKSNKLIFRNEGILFKAVLENLPVEINNRIVGGNK
jgi:V8-like Glu-specific endopeptidase